jgi:hypothetical protein
MQLAFGKLERDVRMNKKNISLFIGILLIVNIIISSGLASAIASSVTRSFSSSVLNPGEVLNVTLDINIVGGETYYLIDEIYPSTSWIVTNNGGGDEITNPPHIFWTVLSGATSTSYTYSMTVPDQPGTHTFSGEYAFEGGAETDIQGDTQIEIISGTTPTIKINEFESNPLSGNEWIELYNPNSFEVDISGWKVYDGLSSPSLIYTIPSSTNISAFDYYVFELTSTKLNNDDEFITLKDSSDIEIDQTPTLEDGDEDDNTWQRLPDGKNNWQFISSTKNDMNHENTIEDDLMINYVRGKILIEGVEATAGTQYKVEVLTGANAGYEYIGEIDENIPASLQGNGYFDTLDKTEFVTGEDFKVSGIITGYECHTEGTFENGGNGDFNTEQGLIVVECNLPNNPPVLDPIGDKQTDELVLLEFNITANDDDNDTLTFSVMDLPNGASFLDNGDYGTFSWTPASNDSGSYNVEFIVDDSEEQDSETITIDVNNINHLPELSFIENKTLDEDESDSFIVSASDIDLDELTFSIIDENINQVNCEIVSDTGNLTINPAENWNGNASCEVQVDDGNSGTDNQIFYIEVFSINDAPIFSGKIKNITWNEDENLIDYLNLEDYFSDVDSELEYEFIGNYFVDIQENNGLVSFFPQQDWYGYENIVINATDGEYEVLSNAFSLNVFDVGEPPEFGQMNCDDEIDEDTGYSCVLNASDFEDDEITFSIVDEDNLICQINGDELEYQGEEDYNGQASCTIKAEDNDGYDEFTLEVDILPINDAPEITDYEPEGVVKLFEYTEQEFSITVEDVDGDNLDYLWFLQGVQTGETDSDYLFNKSKENYNLLAFVTDGILNNSYEWSVFVGDIGDFTCQEVGGDSCTENEICKGEFLGVYDTDSCCNIKCEEKPPEFRDIDTCGKDEINLSEDIVINIKEPDDEDEFEIGGYIDVEVEIENNLGKDEDFDYEVYFYDINDDEIIEDEDDSDDVDDGDSVDFETEFEVPLDIDDGNRFAIYVRASDEDENYCNENYVEIDIERKEHDVILENLGISPEGEILCGDYVELELRLENRGKEEEDIFIFLEIPELGIYEESEEFELEEYGEDDFVKKNLYFKIPENATQGKYELEITLDYDDEKTIKKEIILGECKSLEYKIVEHKKEISLGGINKESKDVDDDRIIFIILIIITIITLLFITYLIIIIIRAF